MSALVAAIIFMVALVFRSPEPEPVAAEPVQAEPDQAEGVAASNEPARSRSTIFEPFGGGRNVLDIIGKGGAAGSAGTGRGGGGSGTGFENHGVLRRGPRKWPPPADDPTEEWRGSLRR